MLSGATRLSTLSPVLACLDLAHSVGHRRSDHRFGSEADIRSATRTTQGKLGGGRLRPLEILRNYITTADGSRRRRGECQRHRTVCASGWTGSRLHTQLSNATCDQPPDQVSCAANGGRCRGRDRPVRPATKGEGNPWPWSAKIGFDQALLIEGLCLAPGLSDTTTTGSPRDGRRSRSRNTRRLDQRREHSLAGVARRPESVGNSYHMSGISAGVTRLNCPLLSQE